MKLHRLTSAGVPRFPRRLARGALALVVIAGLCFAALGPLRMRSSGESDPRPALRLDAKGKPQAIEVVNLPRADLERLAKAKLDEAGWQALFSVHVSSADNLAMAGSYRIAGDTLRFEPQFPLTPGLRYVAMFRPTRLPGRTEGDELRTTFELPKPELGPPPVVTHVYPSGDTLPENTLRLYLHFSAPMSRGEAYQKVRLLDEAGKQVEVPFLELGEELWDRAGKRFTLYFDPGRIKRGLKPREEDGPCLIEGKSYTFVIERSWKGADGQPLKQSFEKKFKVLAPDDTPPDPANWKITAPRAKSKEPLAVKLPEPLDHALLHRLLWVVDAAGQRVPGKIAVSSGETVWQFTPEEAWQPGRFDLVVDTTIEDRAGNTIGKPFELDVFKPIGKEIKSKTVKRTLEVK
ncbi:MAG: hypothetical protein AB7K24_25450 [Gemmataceae bacterium]